MCVPVRVCGLPSVLRLLVNVGQDVGGAAGPLAHHHRDGGALLKVLADGEDHVGTPLEYQGHDGDALADACRGLESGAVPSMHSSFAQRFIRSSLFERRRKKNFYFETDVW